MNFTIYFNAIEKFKGNWPYSDEQFREVNALWPTLVNSQSLDDKEFQAVFIREMLETYRRLPDHERVPRYISAFLFGSSDIKNNVIRFPYLHHVDTLARSFMHFAETAEVLEAFQPHFTEAENLMARATSLSVEQFSAAEDELRQRIFRRHTEVRNTRPGLIKWNGDYS